MKNYIKKFWVSLNKAILLDAGMQRHEILQLKSSSLLHSCENIGYQGKLVRLGILTALVETRQGKYWLEWQMMNKLRFSLLFKEK